MGQLHVACSTCRLRVVCVDLTGSAKEAKVDRSASWAQNAQKTATEVGRQGDGSRSVVTLTTPNCFLAHLARFLAPFSRAQNSPPHSASQATSRNASGSRCLFTPETPSDERKHARSGVLHHTTIERAVVQCQQAGKSCSCWVSCTGCSHDWPLRLSICTMSIHYLAMSATSRRGRLIKSTL